MSLALIPTLDSKTKLAQKHKNTFGLLPGKEGSCPGCTEGPGGCWEVKAGRRTWRTCYVDKLIRAYPGVRRVLSHNTDLLKNSNYTEMVSTLTTEFDRFYKSSLKNNPDGSTLYYRLHWSGDIFSDDYAKALNEAMLKFPHIRFWGYTRTFSAVKYITTKNCIMYISTDPVNVLDGIVEYYDNGDNIRFAYMGTRDDNFVDTTTILRILMWRNKLRLMFGLEQTAIPAREDIISKSNMVECPVDKGKLKLTYGCKNCKMCYNNAQKGKNNIWFNVR